ncbi:uncharacterized protein LOC122648024 [Telopea speciosissima]|uniref:uncharacterized protein LOC122648024 n=1 Tax=Telopea speciosissima TaxID=54955 RepID=UPI001CC384D2|nr:uncharacterized protein LOC122648024 [Telopea speciosissima]
MESCNHILLDCPFARATWFGSDLTFIVPSNAPPRPENLLQAWDRFGFPSKKSSAEVLSLFSFVCWSLWLARNELIFNHKELSPVEVFSKAQQAFNGFMDIENGKVLNTGQAFGYVETSPTPKWKSPSAGTLKLNCDAALPRDSIMGGVGFIIRNHLGIPSIAVSEPLVFDEALIGEALAILKGVSAAADAEHHQVEVESDNLEMVTFLNGVNSHPPLSVASIVEDIAHIASSIPYCTFVHVSRGANFAAHSLARMALSLASMTV